MTVANWQLKSRYSLLSLLLVAGCGGPASNQTEFVYLPHSKQTSLHWRTIEQHCEHCQVTDRATEKPDEILANEALKALLDLHLAGSETPVCSDAGLRSSAGVVLVTNRPKICEESCESTDIEMVSSVEAAEKLRKPNTWRLVELSFQGAVSLAGENGVVVTCGTGHSGTIYSVHTLVAIRNARGEVQFVAWFESA